MPLQKNGFEFKYMNNSPSNSPLVTVILPVKNGHKTIIRAVQSVIDQTYRPIEIIVVNEHAGFKTASKEENLGNQEASESQEARENRLSEDLKSLLNSHFGQYPFFRIIDGLAQGPGVARDMAVKAGNGPYVAFLDDDDIWSQTDKLALQMAFLTNPANSEIEVVGTETTYFIDEFGEAVKTITQPTNPKDVHNQMLLRNPLITSSVLIRKDAYLRAGGFKPMYLAEEYDLWLRMAREKNVIANVPNTSIKYTFRSNSISQRRKLGMAKNVLILVLKNIRYYPNRILAIIKAKLRILKALF